MTSCDVSGKGVDVLQDSSCDEFEPPRKRTAPPHQCPHCLAHYTRKTRLNKHLRDAHNEDDRRADKRFQCPVAGCDGKLFRLASELREHVDEAHEGMPCTFLEFRK